MGENRSGLYCAVLHLSVTCSVSYQHISTISRSHYKSFMLRCVDKVACRQCYNRTRKSVKDQNSFKHFAFTYSVRRMYQPPQTHTELIKQVGIRFGHLCYRVKTRSKLTLLMNSSMGFDISKHTTLLTWPIRKTSIN